MTDPEVAHPEQHNHYEQLNAERRLGRFSPSTVRAAWWAWRSVRRAKRDLAAHGLTTRVQPPPASLPWGSRTGVLGVLDRLDPTCLERSLVLQAWLSAHRVLVDVVVGVKSDAGAVRAHAWLEGINHPEEYVSYTEIHRIPPR